MIKAKKYPIIENKAIRGGLRESLQRYSIYYLFPEFNPDNTIRYTPKISLEHFIEKKDVEKQRPSSLRFDNEVFLKELILELIEALAFFEKAKHKDIKINSEIGNAFYTKRITDLLREVNDAYKRKLLDR